MFDQARKSHATVIAVNLATNNTTLKAHQMRHLYGIYVEDIAAAYFNIYKTYGWLPQDESLKSQDNRLDKHVTYGIYFFGGVDMIWGSRGSMRYHQRCLGSRRKDVFNSKFHCSWFLRQMAQEERNQWRKRMGPQRSLYSQCAEARNSNRAGHQLG